MPCLAQLDNFQRESAPLDVCKDPPTMPLRAHPEIRGKASPETQRRCAGAPAQWPAEMSSRVGREARLPSALFITMPFDRPRRNRQLSVMRHRTQRVLCDRHPALLRIFNVVGRSSPAIPVVQLLQMGQSCTIKIAIGQRQMFHPVLPFCLQIHHQNHRASTNHPFHLQTQNSAYSAQPIAVFVWRIVAVVGNYRACLVSTPPLFCA